MIQFHVDGLDETFEFVIVFGKDTSKDGNQGANYGSKTEFSVVSCKMSSTIDFLVEIYC